MQFDIPHSSTVSHELPIFTQMSQESGKPVSEVKARYKQEIIDQHNKALDDPSQFPMDSQGENSITDMAVQSLRQKLQHPEEDIDEDEEYNELFNLEPGEQDPGAQPFALDNMDLGFSDEGMQSLDQVSDTMDDFGSDMSAGDINADIEPPNPDEPSDTLPEDGTESIPEENGEGAPEEGAPAESGDDSGLNFEF